MNGDELSTILSRLDRLESKVDQLAIRYERHEAQAEKAEKLADEFRRFVYTVSAGVIVTFIISVSGFVLTLLRNGGPN